MEVPASYLARSIAAEHLDKPQLSGIGLAPHQEARRLVRLIQCPVCSKPFTDPVTLPCGRSLCRSCLPEPRKRAIATYPSLPGRDREVPCFDSACCHRCHNWADCSHDVVLGKIATSIADVVAARNAFAPGNHLRDFYTQTCDTADPSHTLLTITSSLGRLVDIYNLASLGLLNRDVEVVYAAPPNLDDSVAPHGDNAYINYLTKMHIHETNTESTAPIDDLVLAELFDATSKELDCQVCYNVFLDPITTACGHTFCRTCLAPALDHSRACPACRRKVYLPPSLRLQPSNRVLNDFLMALCPDTVAARLAYDPTSHPNLESMETPLFVVANAFPGCPLFLRIFEPRYRLMLSRALAGNRTFGVVGYNTKGVTQGDLGRVQFMQYGTLLHIEHSELMEDGTSFIEAKGITRFCVKSFSVKDNYFVGNVQRVEDMSLADEEQLEIADTFQAAGLLASHNPSLQEMIPDSMSTEALLTFGKGFVNRMRARSETWLDTRIMAIYGEPPEDAAIFPFWLASILPIDEPSKYELLKTTSVRQRLKTSTKWIMHFESSPRM